MKVFGGLEISAGPKEAELPPSEKKKLFTYQGVIDGIITGRIKRIAVLTGAGISTNAGIPDFRSPGSGLYSQMEKYKLPFPEAVFSIEYFLKDPRPFFTIAKGMTGKYVPTKFHYFIRLLQDKGLLLKNFTQNIDNLEGDAGVKKELLVQAHGSVAGAHCTGCGKEVDIKLMMAHIEKGEPLFCECKAPCKPDIVMFGEALPISFSMQMNDVASADLVIIAGTSLKVFPFSVLMDLAGPNTPRLVFDIKEPDKIKESKDDRNIFVPGNCEVSIEEFVHKLKLDVEFKALLAAREELRKKYEEEKKKAKI